MNHVKVCFDIFEAGDVYLAIPEGGYVLHEEARSLVVCDAKGNHVAGANGVRHWEIEEGDA